MHDTRRMFLTKLAALTAATGLFSREAIAGAPALDTPAERYLWAMLSGVEVGAPFYGDWYLVDAYPPMAGGVTLVIAKGTKGDPLRVDVCRRAEPPKAPAYTAHLELFTMDGGGGVKLIPDDLIDALQALAEQLEDNDAQFALSRKLLTHGERVDRFHDFMMRAAKELAPTAPRD